MACRRGFFFPDGVCNVIPELIGHTPAQAIPRQDLNFTLLTCVRCQERMHMYIIEVCFCSRAIILNVHNWRFQQLVYHDSSA